VATTSLPIARSWSGPNATPIWMVAAGLFGLNSLPTRHQASDGITQGRPHRTRWESQPSAWRVNVCAALSSASPVAWSPSRCPSARRSACIGSPAVTSAHCCLGRWPFGAPEPTRSRQDETQIELDFEGDAPSWKPGRHSIWSATRVMERSEGIRTGNGADCSRWATIDRACSSVQVEAGSEAPPGA
jgi:hypothetical protein